MLDAEALAYNSSRSITNDSLTKWVVNFLYAAELTLQYFKDKHNYSGFDGNGQVPIKIILEMDGSNILDWGPIGFYYHPELHMVLFTDEMTSTKRTFNLSSFSHEFTHGIIAHSNIYYPVEYPENRAIQEGLPSVFAVSIENYLRKSKGDPITWKFGYLNDFPNCSDCDYSNPKGTISCYDTSYVKNPDTYLKENYQVSKDPDVQTNSCILGHWYYLLADTTDLGGYNCGTNDYGIPYCVQAIGADKIEAILFKTMTQYLDVGDGFSEFASKTLEAAKALGYANGSLEYEAIREAWKAIGVYGMHSPNDYKHQFVTAPSHYNDLVTLKVQTYKEVFINSPILLARLYNYPEGNFPEHNVFRKSINPYSENLNTYNCIDSDQDGYFDNMALGTENTSKWGVNILWASQQTFTYWQQMHQYTPFATSLIKSYIPSPNDEKGVKDTIYLSGLAPNYNIELQYIIDSVLLGQQYNTFPIVTFDRVAYKLNSLPALSNPKFNPNLFASKVLYEAFNNIMSLSVSNWYRKKQGKPSEWFINPELSDFPMKYYKNFANPNMLQCAKLYNGAFFDPTYAGPSSVYANAGVAEYLYHLLSFGTNINQDPNSAPVYVELMNELGNKYKIIGLGDSLASRIFFKAFTENLFNDPNMDFLKVPSALLKAASDLGHEKYSLPYISIYDACYAVNLLNQSHASSLATFPADGAEVCSLPAYIEIETYSKYEDKDNSRVFEVCEDPSFDESQFTVYRFASFVSKSISSPLNQQTVNMRGGRVYLKGDTEYFWRSKAKIECLPLPGDQKDPFCDAVAAYNDWSNIHHFKTCSLESLPISPTHTQSNVHPWDTSFVYNAPAEIDSSLLRIEHINSGEIIDVTRKYEFLELNDDNTSEIQLKKILRVNELYGWKLKHYADSLGSPEGIDKNGNKIGQIGPALEFPWSNNDNYLEFTTGKPKVEKLLYPADKSPVPPIGKDISFEWQVVPGAELYQVRVSPDKNFQNEVKDFMLHKEDFDASFSTIENSFKLKVKPEELPCSLDEGTVCYWKVIPAGPTDPPHVPAAEWGNESVIYSFVIDHSLIPTPILVSPNNIIDYQSKEDSVEYHFVVPMPAKKLEYVVYRTSNNADTLIKKVIDIDNNTNNSTISVFEMVKSAAWLDDFVKGGYICVARLVGENENGKPINGPYSQEFSYDLRPPTPKAHWPEDNQTIPISQEGTIMNTLFEWKGWSGDEIEFVLYEDLPGGEIIEVFNKQGTFKSINLGGLKCGSKYHYVVYASNNNGLIESKAFEDGLLTGDEHDLMNNHFYTESGIFCTHEESQNSPPIAETDEVSAPWPNPNDDNGNSGGGSSDCITTIIMEQGDFIIEHTGLMGIKMNMLTPCEGYRELKYVVSSDPTVELESVLWPIGTQATCPEQELYPGTYFFWVISVDPPNYNSVVYPGSIFVYYKYQKVFEKHFGPIDYVKDADIGTFKIEIK